MATGKSVLNLDTIIGGRERITIDRKKYEIRSAGEFVALDYEAKAAKFTRLGMLGKKKQPNKREVVEYSTLLRELCWDVLIAPPEVHARLNDVHRAQVITFFSGLLSKMAKRTLATGAATNGQKRSRSAPSARA
jgi:hypothetical protein